MNFYKEKFNQISNTGKEVIILKSNGDCECFEKDNLLMSEPDINCNLCFGTGKHRTFIETQKIRYEIGSSGNLGYFEKEDLNKATFDIYSFYFPEQYYFLNNDDIIVIKDNQDNLVTAFEIINKETYKNNDFIYYEVFAKKINYLNVEVVNERRKIK